MVNIFFVLAWSNRLSTYNISKHFLKQVEEYNGEYFDDRFSGHNYIRRYLTYEIETFEIGKTFVLKLKYIADFIEIHIHDKN